MKRGPRRKRGARSKESLSVWRRTAGRKRGGVNGGGNGAETHQALVSGARQPAEKKATPANTNRMAQPTWESSIQWATQGRWRKTQ